MFSPKIVPYQPNAATRARRIDPEEWERQRPRLEGLYVNGDKKLEEVMEIMSLSGFHASTPELTVVRHFSRRQYTQKLNDWSLYKNVSSKVMKCALRKRARAGGHDVSIKYRGTTITKENMDRWQKRVSTFNPLSSPTASTPSQLNVDSPHVALSPQQRDTIRSSVAQSQPITDYHKSNADSDDDDDLISVAYDEIRRSVSPQIAQYIFRRQDSSSPLTMKSLAATGWTSMSVLALSMNESELLKLTEHNLEDLGKVATNLWNVGNNQCLVYCTHICEVLLARTSLSADRDLEEQNTWRLNLAYTYLRMRRNPECEAVLTAAITATEPANPDNHLSHTCRSLLGVLRSQAGQHDNAIALCTQAVMSLRSRPGLSHYVTWEAHERLGDVLRKGGEIQKVLTLRQDFYVDIYRSVSAQLLSGLCASLELCETYIQTWMPETRLRKLARSHYPSDLPLDISQTHALILKEVVEAGLETTASKPFPEVLVKLESCTGMWLSTILGNWVKLVNRRIDPGQPLEPSSLRQNALQVVKDLKDSKFLVPLYVFTILIPHSEPYQRREQELIDSLQKVVTYPANPTEAYVSTSSDDAGSSESVSSISTGYGFSRINSLNRPQTSPDTSKPANLGSSWNATSASQSRFDGITTANALPSPNHIQPGPGLSTALVQPRTHAGLDPVANDTRRPEVSVNI